MRVRRGTIFTLLDDDDRPDSPHNLLRRCTLEDNLSIEEKQDRIGDQLARHPIMAGLPMPCLYEILKEMVLQKHVPGSTICQADRPDDTFFLVEEGTCSVVASDGTVLDPLEAGQSFGDVSLLQVGVRSASLTAIDEVSIWSIESGMYRYIVTSYHSRILERCKTFFHQFDLSDETVAALCDAAEVLEFKSNEVVYDVRLPGSFLSFSSNSSFPFSIRGADGGGFNSLWDSDNRLVDEDNEKEQELDQVDDNEDDLEDIMSSLFFVESGSVSTTIEDGQRQSHGERDCFGLALAAALVQNSSGGNNVRPRPRALEEVTEMMEDDSHSLPNISSPSLFSESAFPYRTDSSSSSTSCLSASTCTSSNSSATASPALMVQERRLSLGRSAATRMLATSDFLAPCSLIRVPLGVVQDIPEVWESLRSGTSLPIRPAPPVEVTSPAMFSPFTSSAFDISTSFSDDAGM